MKRLIIIISLLFPMTTFAQNSYQTLGLSASLSAENMKILSLQFESSKKGTFAVGVIGEALYYSYNMKPFDLNYNDRIGAGGLFLKWRLHEDKNFNAGVFGGLAIGSDNTNFIWYPFG